MDTKILRSLLTIAAVAALGIGVTYAQFTADPVSIAGTQASTGSADLKLCNGDSANGWRTLISPALSAGDLIPGGEVELTLDRNIYIGNDSGNPDDNDLDGVCNSYDADRASSDVPLDLIPKITSVDCGGHPDLKEDITLTISINGADSTKTLNGWLGNTTDTLGTSLLVDEISEVNLTAHLSSDAEDQDSTCTFDFDISGIQTEV